MTNIKNLEKKIPRYYDHKCAHDITHIKRVLKIAEEISKNEKNVNFRVLKASCLLHDIARKKEEQGKCTCHAKEGAKIAKKILKKLNFPNTEIAQITYAIKVHRRSKGIQAKTIEAKILQDADRIDIFGAIGITRTIIRHSKNKDAVIHSLNARKLNSDKEYNTESIFEVIKIRQQIDTNNFNTKTGRIIATKRAKFLKNFVKQFEEEWAE